MNAYVLSHNLDGEGQRLRLMSELLDPLQQQHLRRLDVGPGLQCLEVGCGNGSISQWLAEQVAPNGHVVASDIETSCVAGLTAPRLEVRQLDILHGEVEQARYDLVVTRALLHHLPAPLAALERMIAALKPGGVLLVTEPDMLPATVAGPESVRTFWQGWFRWAEASGIDYFVGAKLPEMLDGLGMEEISAEGHTAFAKGGSPWARYWVQTAHELRTGLAAEGHVTDEAFAAFAAQMEDPHYWTAAITFVAASGRKPA